MLLNNFYNIVKFNKTSDNEIIAEIKLNSNHQIFEGHFPGNPVVPGVVSVQIINEVLTEHLGTKLMTSNAKSIKFTSMINPNLNPNLSIKINFSETEDDNFKVIAQIFYEEIIFLKFNGTFSMLK